jgi:hypothetical protein
MLSSREEDSDFMHGKAKFSRTKMNFSDRNLDVSLTDSLTW